MKAKKPKHIFIVEDNELYAMMLDYILSKKSIYQFVSFKSGEECIKNLYLNPDVIILDFGLPGIDGYNTLLEIKKHNADIHVMMLSSNTDPILATKLLKAGADEYILKQGHGEDQIIEKIEKLLSKDENKKSFEQKIKDINFLEKTFFVILLLIILTIGVAYWR